MIELRDIEGWDADEVCASLGLSAANQRVLLHRARCAVRAAIEEYFAERGGRSMTYEDLPCVDFVELATEYLEGALPVERRLIVERHLAFCLPCVDYLEQMRTVVRSAGALKDDVPEPVMESLWRPSGTYPARVLH